LYVDFIYLTSENYPGLIQTTTAVDVDKYINWYKSAQWDELGNPF